MASVFIPQVEDLVYNYLGIPRKKTVETPETSNGKVGGENDLLPTDLEAVSPGSVKSNEDKNDDMDISEGKEEKMEVDEESKPEKDDTAVIESIDKEKIDQESRLSGISELTINDSECSIDKSSIPLPTEEIKLENIPAPENSPPKITSKNIDLEKINLPKEPNLSTDIPLPDEILKGDKEPYFKPIQLQSDEDDSSSDSSLIRNMSPLTPIRNFNNENSCDAQQAFENNSDGKNDEQKEPSTFRFTIETKSPENSMDEVKTEKKEPEQQNVPFEFPNQANINTFNTPLYEDSSNSNNLQIDYESDVSKAMAEIKLPEVDQNSGDSTRKERKPEEKKSSHKSSHRSRDSHRHSSSKDKRSDSKQSSSRDSSRHEKKSSKDDKSRSNHKERSSDRGDKKESRDSSKHRSSNSHKSSSHKDSKHRSSSSSKHSSKDDKRSSSSSQKDRDKSEKSSSDKSKDRSKDSKSSSHRSDKDRKSSSKSKSDEKENKEKKEKKDTDDHYSLSGRGNPNRRSTDRDSNDGSSSSKGSHNPSGSKTTESKKETKSSSKSDNATTSSNSTSPSDKDHIVNVTDAKTVSQKPIRVDTHLETPVASPPRLPFVPDVTLKKPRFAANLQEAKKMVKMRKFLEEEQKRMNQEAALLLEFQANVRPSLSQVYSSIPGPELEFACIPNAVQPRQQVIIVEDTPVVQESPVEINKDNVVIEVENAQEKESNEESIMSDAKVEVSEETKDMIAETLIAMHQERNRQTDKHEDINEIITVVEIANSIEDNTSLLKTLTSNDNEDNLVIDEVDSAPDNECQDKAIEVEEKLSKEDGSKKHTELFEVTIITEELSESEETSNTDNSNKETKSELPEHTEENLLHYFGEHEKYNTEIERDTFSKFLKAFTEKTCRNKMYLLNCDSYEENLIREVSNSFGNFDIINYYKNGHLKPSKNIVKNVNVATEITLPTKTSTDCEKAAQYSSPVFSPVKSECSFELSSDYDAKLEEMVNKTSRQEIMEIILGSAIDESPSKMPKIDYCTESNIVNEEINNLKRKINELESSVNNNKPVLTPNKMRKLSESDQISSTTEGKIFRSHIINSMYIYDF